MEGYTFSFSMKKLFALLALTSLTCPVFAQLGDLVKKVPGIPGVDSIFKKGPAITTSLKDAKWEAADQDGVNPESKPLSTLKRGPHGGFILEEGDYSSTMQSYCLHAGTYGPTRGDAYLYAPVKGPSAPFSFRTRSITQKSSSEKFSICFGLSLRERSSRICLAIFKP